MPQGPNLELKLGPLRFEVAFPDGTRAEVPLDPAAAQSLALALLAQTGSKLLPEVSAAIIEAEAGAEPHGEALRKREQCARNAGEDQRCRILQ